MTQLILPISDKDHFKGSSNAPITLVEYGDYQCPLCKLSQPIIQQLQKELNNQLKFIFRHFPLKKTHPCAQLASEAAEAAGLQGKYWEMHDLLYQNQLVLNPDNITALSQELGLDYEKFQHDLTSSYVKEKIDEDFSQGVRSGVNGIPCFYINRNRYDGDSSYSGLKNYLQTILNQRVS